MITPPRVDAYELEEADYLLFPKPTPALNTIATRVYGRRYVAQQTGDMMSNNSYHEFNLSDADWRAELLEDWTYDGETGGGRRAIAAWQALPLGKFDDLDGVRAAPTPDVILADLIERGELPAGRYFLHVWW